MISVSSFVDWALKLTGNSAKITLNDAVQHLYHFCATLPSDPYVDTRPIFTFSESVVFGNVKAVTAKVVLPSSVDASVREACSLSEWKTEKFAKRDAAFEAYIALYHAGLISDHLLPLKWADEAVAEAHSAVRKIASLVEVPGPINMWSQVAQEWQDIETLYASTVMIHHNGEAIAELAMLLPRPLPSISNFELYWDLNTSFTAIISTSSPLERAKDFIASASEITWLLLSSVIRQRMDPTRQDFVALFIPPDSRDLKAWTAPFRGTTSAETLLGSIASANIGIVRDLKENGKPYTFRDVLRGRSQAVANTEDCIMVVDGEIAPAVDYLEVARLSKRTDFLHILPLHDQETTVELGSRRFMSLPMRNCEVDNLPFAYARFAMLVPSIMHQVEIGLVAEHLCKTLLSSVHFNDLSLVETAISASGARERTNYQSMEFLVSSLSNPCFRSARY